MDFIQKCHIAAGGPVKSLGKAMEKHGKSIKKNKKRTANPKIDSPSSFQRLKADISPDVCVCRSIHGSKPDGP